LLKGSCLCGTIRYEVSGSLGPVGHCHCRTCRKAHSAAFNTAASVTRQSFRWVAGETRVASFESAPGKRRYFCPVCGSHLMAAWDGRPEVILRIGSLDEGPNDRPVAHIWTSLKAPWFEITDALPRFEESAPARRP